mmetsp:Transcript_28289/g.97739  ORF Transcript_28289/g.97739 Transcript_28289/m.97739 type:complete len:201 (+) Transcript_28289:260-862(+)
MCSHGSHTPVPSSQYKPRSQDTPATAHASPAAALPWHVSVHTAPGDAQSSESAQLPPTRLRVWHSPLARTHVSGAKPGALAHVPLPRHRPPGADISSHTGAAPAAAKLPAPPSDTHPRPPPQTSMRCPMAYPGCAASVGCQHVSPTSRSAVTSSATVAMAAQSCRGDDGAGAAAVTVKVRSAPTNTAGDIAPIRRICATL